MKPILYIKPGCPWCDEVEDWLRRQGIAYEAVNVSRDREGMRAMIEISGQSKAPTLDWDGRSR